MLQIYKKITQNDLDSDLYFFFWSQKKERGANYRGGAKYREYGIHDLFIFSFFICFYFFLNALSHLYERVCPSVRPLARWSVHWLVRLSIRRLVRHAQIEFLRNGLN